MNSLYTLVCYVPRCVTVLFRHCYIRSIHKHHQSSQPNPVLQLQRHQMHNNPPPHSSYPIPTPYSSPVSLILLSSSPSKKSHPPNAPSVSLCSLAPQTTK